MQRSLSADQKTVVHCSAGVGRSGVVVLTDMLMETIAAKESFNIHSCLRELRKQRMHLVQTPHQYVFTHQAMLHYIEAVLDGSDQESNC